MSDVVAHLREVPLFQGMTENAIEAVAGLAREIRFEPGAAVMREGEPGDAFFVLVDGSVTVSRNGATITRLGPGEFLGEISLLDGKPRTATAVADEPIKALVVRRPAFLELMETYGAVRLGILMALTDRIRRDATASTD